MSSEPPPPQLSARELDVLRLVEGGATATHIAQALNIDRETVALTIVEIRRALGVRSTRAALEIARSLPGWEQAGSA